MKTLQFCLLLVCCLYSPVIQAQDMDLTDFLGVWTRGSAREGQPSTVIISEDRYGFRIQMYVAQNSAVGDRMYEEELDFGYLEEKTARNGTRYWGAEFPGMQIAIRPDLVEGMLNIRTFEARDDGNAKKWTTRSGNSTIPTTSENYLFARKSISIPSSSNERADIEFVNSTDYTVDVYRETAEGRRIFVKSLWPGAAYVQQGQRNDNWLVWDRNSSRIIAAVRGLQTWQRFDIESRALPLEPTRPSSTVHTLSTPYQTKIQDLVPEVKFWNNTNRTVAIFSTDRNDNSADFRMRLAPGQQFIDKSAIDVVWIIKDAVTNETVYRYKVTREPKQTVYIPD